MELETISPENLQALTNLMLELWKDCIYEEEYENCKRILSAENEIVYLLSEQDNYIAFIQLNLRNDYVEGSTSSPVAYIEGLYVKPGYQGQGIGKMLVKSAEEWGREKGCKQLGSDTELQNSESIEFHKKAGFEEVSSIVCFLKDIK